MIKSTTAYACQIEVLGVDRCLTTFLATLELVR